MPQNHQWPAHAADAIRTDRCRILLVEGSASDATLLAAALNGGGLACVCVRVETEAEYLEALASAPDVILSEYSLPAFGALRALDLLRERALDIPLIVVTGVVGDEAAAACLDRGAVDYLLKDRLARLAAAVSRALAERAAREDQRAAERQASAMARFPAENPNPVLRVALDGTILYANPASAPVLEAWGTLVGEHISAAPRTLIASAFERGETQEMDIRAGGREYSLLAVPVRDQGYCNLYLTDVTRRSQTEAALRDSEQQFRLIANNVSDMVSHVEIDGTILYASPSHEAVLGFPLEWFRGRSAYELVHPDDFPDLRAKVERDLTMRKSERFEFRCRCADGRYMWLESHHSFLLNEAGGPIGAVLSWRDITERRRLTDDLRARTEDLERFNRMAVGRELRMVELKQRINALSRRLGEPSPYPGAGDPSAGFPEHTASPNRQEMVS